MVKKAVKPVPETAEPQDVNGRTLVMDTIDGTVRVTIPPGSRVTFGPTIPYAQKSQSYGESRDRGYSLRVYETKSNDSLIAVFSGVRSFRDTAIPHHKLLIQEAGKKVWKSDETGYKVENEVTTNRQWVDFNNPQLGEGD